jgi:hypothetical protein
MFLDRCAPVSLILPSFSFPLLRAHRRRPCRVFPASAESLDGSAGTATADLDLLSSVVNNWSRPQQLSAKAVLFGSGSSSKTLRQVHCSWPRASAHSCAVSNYGRREHLATAGFFQRLEWWRRGRSCCGRCDHIT